MIKTSCFKQEAILVHHTLPGPRTSSRADTDTRSSRTLSYCPPPLPLASASLTATNHTALPDDSFEQPPPSSPPTPYRSFSRPPRESKLSNQSNCAKQIETAPSDPSPTPTSKTPCSPSLATGGSRHHKTASAVHPAVPHSSQNCDRGTASALQFPYRNFVINLRLRGARRLQHVFGEVALDQHLRDTLAHVVATATR